MAIDNSGIKHGKFDQKFEPGEKVMVRRLGDGNEYRAKVAGIVTNESPGRIMIIEIVDPFNAAYAFTHIPMPEVCLDKESWSDD